LDQLLLSGTEYTGGVGIRQADIQTAKSFLSEPIISEVEIVIEKLNRYKSPRAHQIPAELFQAGEETLHCEIHKLMKLIWNKEELLHQ
jgi:hypothetical protein